MAYQTESLTPSISAKLVALQQQMDAGQLTVALSVDSNDSESSSSSLLLSEALFHRAPESFIERSSVGTMRFLTREIQNFYTNYLASKEPFHISLSNYPDLEQLQGFTSVFTAITDRPFVIDSIKEFFRIRGIQTHAVLHPILKQPGGPDVSLSYIQIDLIPSPESLNDLQEELASHLVDLIYVTDDFTAMLVRAETSARLLEKVSDTKNDLGAEQHEVASFLRWLTDGGFVFLGHREWEIEKGPRNADAPLLHPIKNADLGLFRSTSPLSETRFQELDRDTNFLLTNKHLPFYCTQIFDRSPVHRSAKLLLVLLKVPSPELQTLKLQCFVGLLTSRASAQEASSVPIIRQKLKKIIEAERRKPNSHAYKETLAIIDSIPKSELLRRNIDSLRADLNVVLNLNDRDDAQVTVHLGQLRRFLSAMVIIPAAHYSSSIRREVQHFLELEFGAPENSAEYFLASTDQAFVRIHFVLRNRDYLEVEPDIARIRKAVRNIAMNWADRLKAALLGYISDPEALAACRKLATLFPEEYQAATKIEDAVRDTKHLALLTENNPLEISIQLSATNSRPLRYELKLFRFGTPLTLSEIVPHLESVGLKVLDETTTQLQSNGDDIFRGIYTVYVEAPEAPLNENNIELVLIPGIKSIFNGQAERDVLNRLMPMAGLNLKQIALLRSFKRYLRQIRAFPSNISASGTIASYPALARLLVHYFETKFDPEQFKSSSEARSIALKSIRAEISDALKNVNDITHDRGFRALLNLIDGIVRTNYFFSTTDGILAHKIDCHKLATMPDPRPLFEIFVYSPELEGVHLRGAKVARGGIRWSDRKDDVRNEILGLLKTQMVKNSIIVPSGAKGGFVIRAESPSGSHTYAQVEYYYTKFIRTLLSLTDNLNEQNNVVHPQNAVAYDANDPYFVVAADKGTATFSDVANKLSMEEFDFWLGDAFASGGSNGYDHKKYGITARGAWITTCRHFRELGIDVLHQPFTAVGIGDMSGDVFGNGLLLSKNIRLIGAFNHRHIFLDPNPDSKVSFEERTRLFALPRSAWTDYNQELLSSGGGIFERSSKEIPLSEEARRALGIQQFVLSGDELIQAILKAPVDLIWNGGIGTYIKAHQETHLSVQDRANDNVRVDARDVRAKVIGEGGNLGLTQQARIEYSRCGGLCNTDAIDNSGGVSLSDLEVNIKILLRDPIRKGLLTTEERNSLLNSLATDACTQVLAMNRTQSAALSLEVRRTKHHIGNFRGFITYLEQLGLLKREHEFLPDDEALDKLERQKLGLTRPELAVLMGYVKAHLATLILESTLPEEAFLQPTLVGYFPGGIAERFLEEAKRHPLRREIIATSIATQLVDLMGSSFVFGLCDDLGKTPIEVITAFVAASEILGTKKLVLELEFLDKAETTNAYLQGMLVVAHALNSMTKWLLAHPQPSMWTEVIQRYQPDFRSLIEHAGAFMSQAELRKYRKLNKQLTAGGFSDSLGQKLVSLEYASSYLEIVDIAFDVKMPVIEIAGLFVEIASKLKLPRILEQATQFDPADRWESIASRSIISEFRETIGLLTKSVILEYGSTALESWGQYAKLRPREISAFENLVEEVQNRPMTVSSLMVLSKHLKAIIRPPALSTIKISSN